MQFNIDIAIFVVFLVITLFVGLRYGRGVRTIEDYALGGRNFSTATLVGTIVATWMSGSGFFITVSKSYTDGLYFTLTSISVVISLFIIGYILAPRITEFLGRLSIAEVMGELYGDKVRFITAVSGIIGTAGLMSVQFKVFGYLFSYLFSQPPSYSIIISGCIVTTYSAFGGIRAVTFTDLLQFITFGISIPLVSISIWWHTDLLQITQQLMHNPVFDYREIFNYKNMKFWELLTLMIYFSIPKTNPGYFNRLFLARDWVQARRAFVIAAVILLIIELLENWIGVLILSNHAGLSGQSIIASIIDTYTYPGLRGLLMIGVIAMSMSTADSHMNAASVLFTNDFCALLKLKIKLVQMQL